MISILRIGILVRKEIGYLLKRINRNRRIGRGGKRENEKRELFVNYLRTIYGHVLVFNMIYLYCEKWRKTQLTMLFLKI